MSIVRTIGGDRLGAGNKKMQVAMHNYERSTHDLSRVWRSSMAPGTLVPCLCEVGLNGDTFDIDLDAMVRTIPTAAPLFGSFKLQIDVFKADMRLYNAVLHNNQFGIGLKMEQVIFPKVNFKTLWGKADYKAIGTPFECSQVAPDSLAHYLGVSGISGVENDDNNQRTIERNFNAVPFLAYYDVFKNYYMNKQEQNAYVIAPNVSNNASTIQNFITEIQTWAGVDAQGNKMPNGSQSWYKGDAPISFALGNNGIILIGFTQYIDKTKIKLYSDTNMEMNVEFIDEWQDNNVYYYRFKSVGNDWIDMDIIIPNCVQSSGYYSPNGIKIELCNANVFDEMREKLLNPTNTGLGKEYVLQFGETEVGQLQAPYCYIGAQEPNTKRSVASFSQCGLMLKTYLSDIMNCWVSDDTINMVNGIASVNTEAGNFTIDALNLAQKVYNMLNRIAVSGGSYYDWQEVIWGEEVRGSVETPIYCGGMSSEIVFEEVVSTADTQTAAAGSQPLGSLAGKGTLAKKNNGHVIIKCDEPCIIMAIASITPRIDYSTGNKWFNTELNTLNDLHKPALDGIGWQDLLAERGYWWGTEKGYNAQGAETFMHRYALGKQPAWLNYMTAVNEVHGDFANKLKAGYMVLARNYDTPEEIENSGLMNNYSAYINPTKFNYAFADTNLYSQNFWVQIALNIQARRKISAKQIPNL